jgi:hypothetical protein
VGPGLRSRQTGTGGTGDVVAGWHADVRYLVTSSTAERCDALDSDMAATPISALLTAVNPGIMRPRLVSTAMPGCS